jgi:hypothetical protein
MRSKIDFYLYPDCPLSPDASLEDSQLLHSLANSFRELRHLPFIRQLPIVNPAIVADAAHDKRKSSLFRSG